MPDLGYAVNAAAWSLAGGVSGWAVGQLMAPTAAAVVIRRWARRKVRDLPPEVADAVVEHVDQVIAETLVPPVNGLPAADTPEPGRRRRGGPAETSRMQLKRWTELEDAISPDEEVVIVPRRRRPSRLTRWFGILLLVMAVSTTVSTLYSARQDKAFVACQGEQNRVFSMSLQQRSDVAKRDRENLTSLARALYLNPTNPEVQRRAYLNYLTRQAQNERLRPETPDLGPECRR